MNKNIPKIYIGLWMFYFLQGVLYKEGGFVSQSIFVVLIVASLFFFIIANNRYSLPKPMRILSVMVVIWSIYGIIPMIFGTGQLAINVAPFEYIKNIYMSVLPIYAFYVFVKKNVLDEDSIRRWVVVFIVVAISSFYKRQNELLMINTGLQEEFTNGTGYVLVAILPLLPLYWRKPVWQYIFLGVCMLYVLMGFKRGAIISGTLCSIWLIYTSFRYNRRNDGKPGRKQMVRLVLVLIMVIFAVFAVQYFMSTSDYFNSRLESTRQGDSSNRDNIYGFFFYYFFHNMTPLDYLFGLGANGTLRIYSNVAHNDWLEIAIDNGVIMLLLYFLYWVSMLKLFFKGDNRSMSNIMFGMFIIIYLFKSIFSFSYSDIPIYSSCALGYVMATYKSKSTSDSTPNR